MSVVNTLEQVVLWAKKTICSKVELKLPDDRKAGDSYPYKLVNPSCHPVYVPTKDRTPPASDDVPIPSLCVQLLPSTETRKGGILRLRFAFLVWDPGQHAKDVFRPGDEGLRQVKDEKFIRTSDGWRDVYNFLDIAMRELRLSESIGDYSLDDEKGIDYGPYTIEGDVPSFYPYWYAWCEFDLRYGNANPTYDKYL